MRLFMLLSNAILCKKVLKIFKIYTSYEPIIQLQNTKSAYPGFKTQKKHNLIKKIKYN